MSRDKGTPDLERLLEDLQYLADSIHDNAPDMEDDDNIAEEYYILASVYTTKQAAEDYLRVMQ